MTTTTLRLQAECRHAVDAMWRARHRVAPFEERVAPGILALVSQAAIVDQHRALTRAWRSRFERAVLS